MSIKCPNCTKGDVHIATSYHAAIAHPMDDRAFGYVVIMGTLYKIRCWVSPGTENFYTKRWGLHCYHCGFEFDELDLPLTWPNWEGYLDKDERDFPSRIPRMRKPRVEGWQGP